MTIPTSLLEYAKKRTPELNLVRTGSESITYTHVTTGIFMLDFALMGGWPENCAITLVGKQHSGKTTLAYKAIGNFQKKYDGSSEDRPKKVCVFIDVERQFSPAWAAANGVNTDELYVITPTNADEAVDLAAAAMEDDAVCLVVLDSIPALVGGKELDKSAEDHAGIGQVALYANRMMRKVSHAIASAHNKGMKKTMININQWRDGISTNPAMKAPRTMPGGKYVRHYASVEVEVYNDKQSTAKDSNDIIVYDMNEHSFKIHKNRTGNSIPDGEFRMRRLANDTHPAGYIDDLHTVVLYASRFNYITGAGQSWNLIDPETGELILEKQKNKTAVIEYIAENRDIRDKLALAIISQHRKKQGLPEHGWC